MDVHIAPEFASAKRRNYTAHFLEDIKRLNDAVPFPFEYKAHVMAASFIAMYPHVVFGLPTDGMLYTWEEQRQRMLEPIGVDLLPPSFAVEWDLPDEEAHKLAPRRLVLGAHKGWLLDGMEAALQKPIFRPDGEQDFQYLLYVVNYVHAEHPPNGWMLDPMSFHLSTDKPLLVRNPYDKHKSKSLDGTSLLFSGIRPTPNYGEDVIPDDMAEGHLAECEVDLVRLIGVIMSHERSDIAFKLDEPSEALNKAREKKGKTPLLPVMLPAGRVV